MFGFSKLFKRVETCHEYVCNYDRPNYTSKLAYVNQYSLIEDIYTWVMQMKEFGFDKKVELVISYNPLNE
jgi:hypothetical protein